MTYRNVFVPDCLPTKPVPIGSGSMKQALPSREDLARAQHDHGRLVHGYELVCCLLAEARMHLARTLNDNWSEFEQDRAAVNFLGGAEAFARLAECDQQGAKLP